MKYKKLFLPKISELEFDPLNPRLPKKLQTKAEKEVVEWMLLDASLIDLVASIGINGFFPGEPLLVVENKQNGKFTVIEGNRRLASCKILNNPELANVKQKTIQNIIQEINPNNIPTEVPAFLFDERNDILEYLGYRHVTGVKSWGALPKAKYLYELYSLDKTDESLYDKSKRLAKKIGSRGDYVMRLLTSYQLFVEFEKNNFYNIPKVSEENIEFSNLVDSATRFSNISSFLNIDFNKNEPLEELNKDNFQELTKWLFERDEKNRTKIGENRNIRILNAVIKSPKALDAFRNNTPIKEAFLLTEEPDKIFIKSIESSIKNLINSKDVAANIFAKTKKQGLPKLDEAENLIVDIRNIIS